MDKNTRVAAAIASPEQAVSHPGGTRAASFTSVVAALDVGETATRSIQVSPYTNLDEIAKQIAQWRDTLRNNVGASVRAARQRTGGDYTIEVCDCLTPRSRMFVVAFVTRTA